MMKKSVFYILSVIIVCSVSHADFVMSITADDTALDVGDSTTLHVWGIADEAVVDNGLYDWSVSAVVDATGVVQVTSASALEPFPVDPGSFITTLNGGGATLGTIDAAAAIQFTATESNAGVALTELFNFDVEAVAVGNVQYSLMNIIGDLFDGTPYDDGLGNVQFAGPGPVISVVAVPEPATMILLGLGSLVAIRRKK